MCFRLTPRSMTLDDLDLDQRFLGISRDFADLGANDITAKRMKIVSDGIVAH